MKLSDDLNYLNAVNIALDRAQDLVAVAQAVVTSCTALKAGDTTGQFADEAAAKAAILEVRDAYNAITVASLADASSYFAS